ncbi:hypothetical protein ACED51_18035, partial [Photobacterium swingsii]|uniref:hypothetical protein n=1 Tax=Photobacterium swingsii TaxID=680026 RepID=UPI00352C196F
KALAEMLEPFSFLVFSVQIADSPLPTISACWVFGSLHPCHIYGVSRNTGTGKLVFILLFFLCKGRICLLMAYLADHG